MAGYIQSNLTPDPKIKAAQQAATADHTDGIIPSNSERLQKVGDGWPRIAYYRMRDKLDKLV